MPVDSRRYYAGGLYHALRAQTALPSRRSQTNSNDEAGRVTTVRLCRMAVIRFRGLTHENEDLLIISNAPIAYPLVAKQSIKERVLNLSAHLPTLTQVSLTLEAEPLQRFYRSRVPRIYIRFDAV